MQGNIRAGCSIIPKGEVYESHIFTKKEEWFKNKAFTKEVKELFTDTINCYVKEESEKLSVFQQGGVYLAMKKIGKNNPKAEEIKADNAARQEWNRTVDVALVEGVPEEDILKIKQEKITDKNAAIYKGIRLVAGYVPSDYPRCERLFTGSNFQI